MPALMFKLVRKCTRFNLRGPILKKFPGGMPPDPLAAP